MLLVKCLVVALIGFLCSDGQVHNTRNKCRLRRTHFWRPRDCSEIQECGRVKSGVFSIFPDGGPKHGIRVFCDHNTAGGGWTVFQRRINGAVNFFRGWENYRKGFGNLFGEHWLGNDNLHLLTQQDSYQLYVHMVDSEGKSAYARYKQFFIHGADEKYKLFVKGYKGTAGDSLSGQNLFKFSTKDQDNDTYTKNCATQFWGAWWYHKCFGSHLNGWYLKPGPHKTYAQGLIWAEFRQAHNSLKHVRMMIKPNRSTFPY